MPQQISQDCRSLSQKGAPPDRPGTLRTDQYLFERIRELTLSYRFIKFWMQGAQVLVEFVDKQQGPDKGVTICLVVRPEKGR